GDNGPARLGYAWTSTSGLFSDASVPAPRFTCTTAGAARISLSVSDGDPGCAASASLDVACTVDSDAPPPADEPPDTPLPVNHPPAPTAPDISVSGTATGTSQIAANDPDLGQQFTYSITTAPARGTATVSATGLVTYTPSVAFAGTDSLT